MDLVCVARKRRAWTFARLQRDGRMPLNPFLPQAWQATPSRFMTLLTHLTRLRVAASAKGMTTLVGPTGPTLSIMITVHGDGKEPLSISEEEPLSYLSIAQPNLLGVDE